ncbi:hypothetical protein Mal4_12440 [Maioricimonas rarisocia]|uniref:Uncharacterized protein n=1 Tax=Maioricimonas rarisocia TaxID=2528026 RepID=A0A517Z370_9PLAN|nr:hypothetical protein Mal4_12440 [Maioricimonas rarisocia]
MWIQAAELPESHEGEPWSRRAPERTQLTSEPTEDAALDRSNLSCSNSRTKVRMKKARRREGDGPGDSFS